MSPVKQLSPPSKSRRSRQQRGANPDADAQLQAERAAAKKLKSSNGLEWGNVFWLALLHLGALAAPFYFTWQGLALTFGLWWFTGCLGICMGYHRLFTHQSFKTYRPVRWLIATIGSLAGEGAAVHWVATHRQHHALSDQPGDPHSPKDGGLWAHMWWLMHAMPKGEYGPFNRRWAPDLTRDRVMVAMDYLFLPLHIAFGAGLMTWGYWLGGFEMAMSFLTWGMFVRLLYVLHSTWLVNSATHMWGYRNYETTDDSRNLWWVAFVSFGEGWHNNHHAYPRMARHGHRWWEIDITFLMIRGLQAVGLAWDVVDHQHHKRFDESLVKPGAA